MRIAVLRSFAVVFSLVILSVGCGGGNSSSGGGSFTIPLTGTWTGTWENDGVGPGSANQGFTNEGLIRAELVADAQGNVSGTATWTGFVCFWNTTGTGSVSVGAVSVTYVDSAGAGGAAAIRVTFNGRRISDTQIDGRWDNDIGCIGEGELTLNRQV